MIYILEGADGTGKTTLASFMAEQLKASIIHAYFNKDWDILHYHKELYKAARIIEEAGSPVIMDRLMLSEHVYGTVFRENPAYSCNGFIEKIIGDNPTTYILCRNDNAVNNHYKNMFKRPEMFDSMEEVVKLYDDYVVKSKQKWFIYDFNKITMNEFYEEIK